MTETVLATAQNQVAFVYNWDFTSNKWVNFASSSKSSQIQIIERKKEFFVKVTPEDGSNQVHEFYLPADVQVTRTRDMIQFPVPDRGDSTGGKLIAVRFKDEQHGHKFTNRASEKIKGFNFPMNIAEPEPVPQEPPPPPVTNQPNVVRRDETFVANERCNEYQSPTLPGSFSVPEKNYNPPQVNPPQFVPKNVENYKGPSPPVSNDVSRQYREPKKPDPPQDASSKGIYIPPHQPNIEPRGPSYNEPRGPAYNEPRGPSYNEPRRPSYNEPRGPSYNEPRGPSYNEPRGPSYNEPRGPSYNEPRGPSYNEPRGPSYNEPRGPSYNEPRGPVYNEPRGPGYNEPRGPGYNEPRGPGYNEPRGPSYNEPRGPVYNEPRGPVYNEPRGPVYNHPHVPNNDPRRPNYNPSYQDPVGPHYENMYQRQEPQRVAYNQPSYPDHSKDLSHSHAEYNPQRHSGGQNQMKYSPHDYGNTASQWIPVNSRHPPDGYRDNSKLNPRQDNLEQYDYVQEPNIPARVPPNKERASNVFPPPDKEEQWYSTASNLYPGPKFANDFGPAPKKRQPGPPPIQPTVSPLVKPQPVPPTSDEPMSINCEEINDFSQRLAESLSAGKVQDAKQLVELLAGLISPLSISGSSETTNVLGSFSMSYQIGAPAPEKKFSLSIMVEPLNGKSYPIYLEVRPSDTIEKLKEICQKRFKIPSECQYWVVGDKLCDDKVCLKDLEIDDATTTFIYIQHPRKAKVSKNTMKEVKDIQDKKPQVSEFDNRPLEPQQNDDGAVFRDAAPVQKDTTPPVIGGVKVMPNQHPGRQANNNYINQAPLVNNPYPIVQLPPPPEPPKPAPPPEPPGWQCPGCTYKNIPYRPGCEICGTPRPVDYIPPPDYVPVEEERKFMDNVYQQQIRMFLENEEREKKEQAQRNYLDLLNTDNESIVTNNEPFDCPVCFTEIDPGDGIRLRGCLHMICKDCLKGSVVHSEESEVKCPYTDGNVECQEPISEREIRAVLERDELEAFFKRGLRQAEALDPNSFHCKTADCPGFCFYEDEVNEFRCQNCGHINCILCKAQHEGMNCQQYQDDLKIKAANDEAARQTQQMLEDMVKNGEAMHCPKCKVIVTKKIGCDWIRCTMCKTEMCWATKGPRWGPKGHGDTSGGCKCGVNRQKCHPDCRNCH